ncbi:DUF6265 family protein [Permianibacter aggregans]|uniref:DUF6265 domain-containing protein n=1 Tax=Permianibacter aggregans TaxID=1510150 RepID=A0A4R6UUT9_9GAMM|nr:DUF6265 family protein [Permianibacter aggregans]QGX41296.1 hypothetical protein E2H98_17145 [Permianibacter aggregans]TDQ51080.1 hypothetical protein EV696_10149 [Permianibacter aggregans]
MKRQWRSGLPSSLLLLCLAASAVQADSPFCFLVGHWQSEENGVVMEELWLPEQHGALHALNRSYPLTPKLDANGQPKRPAFEFLRIEKVGDQWHYLAQPNGRPAVAFALKEVSERHAVFENAEHDFPQRIRYQLDAESHLQVSIAKIDGSGPSMQWRWQRKAGLVTCE